MKLNIREISSRSIWDSFINQHQPHTFLQSWQWGELNRLTNTSIYRLGIYNKKILYGVALVVVVPAKRGAFLFCPHGPILRSDDDIKEAMKVLTMYLKPLAKENNCAFIRFSPLLKNAPQHSDCFTALGYREAPTHMHPELAWMVDITPSQEQLIGAMRKTTRYSIKKAEKDGVNVWSATEQSALDQFWPIYHATVARHHFTPFSKDYLSKQFQVFASDNQALLFFAEYRNEIIATAMIIFCAQQAFYHHGASTQQYPNITASYLLQWQAILEAKRRGCKLYNFWGVVKEEQMNHPWRGLSLFKRGFGGFAEEYVHAKDLVLSPKYWLTYAIEKTRKMKRHL